jgi:transcriptional accessory protein Tex/SPT6
MGAGCRNCGSFLRITHSSDDAEAEGLLALDATRVAPQLYPMAKDLAKAILDEGGAWDPEDDWVLQAHARPNEVEGFNLQVRHISGFS